MGLAWLHPLLCSIRSAPASQGESRLKDDPVWRSGLTATSLFLRYSLAHGGTGGTSSYTCSHCTGMSRSPLSL